MAEKVEKEVQKEEELCSWFAYKRNRCQRTTDSKFCNKHTKVLKDYITLKEDLPCSTTKYLKVVARSKEHLETIMKKYNIDDTIVEVYFPGSYTEEGDISNEDYIEMLTDGTKYYYEKQRGRLCVNKIKILLTVCCVNTGVISFNGDNYCKECYIKHGSKHGFPLFNIVHKE